MKFCSNCGKEWQEGSKFCAYCGAKGDSVDTTQQPQSQSVQQPAQPQQVPPAQAQQVPPMQTQQQVPPVQPQQQVPPIQPQQQYNTNQQAYNAQQQFNGYGQPQNLRPLTDIEKLDLGMIENLKQCFTTKYAKFEGRASRGEYWRFAAVLYLISGILSFLTVISETLGFALVIILCLASICPGLGVAVRRLHDLNKSGGYIFINLIPLVGPIWFVILMASEGNKEPNQYGYHPGFIPVTEDIKRQYNLADTTQSTGIVVLVAIIGVILESIFLH